MILNWLKYSQVNGYFEHLQNMRSDGIRKKSINFVNTEFELFKIRKWTCLDLKSAERTQMFQRSLNWA